MKDIGEKLKEARESMGITIEEASEDLKIRPALIESIEDGDREPFKDVFYLKMFIKNYSKYLGLDYEEMVKEFNEYLFDFTSKISIEDIKKAEKEHSKKTNKVKKDVKIVSPYTLEKNSETKIPRFLIISGIVVFIIIIIYIIVLLTTKPEESTNTIAMEGDVINELA